MLHATWTEWKNLFSLEVYCRTAKLQVDGLVRSYGPQRLRIYRMRPSWDPPTSRRSTTPTTIAPGTPSGGISPSHHRRRRRARLLGDLADARYAWEQIEAAYARGPYAAMREAVAR